MKYNQGDFKSLGSYFRFEWYYVSFFPTNVLPLCDISIHARYVCLNYKNIYGKLVAHNIKVLHINYLQPDLNLNTDVFWENKVYLQ